MAEPWTRRVPGRFRCKAQRCGGTVGVAKSICADVSWRHLLVQSSELRGVSPLLPRAVPPGGFRARVLPRSLPFPSPAHLLSNDPVDAAALFTLTRITITRSSTYTFSPMSRRNVDNDGATVIRKMGDCYRTVRPDPDRSISIRGIVRRIGIGSRK